MKKQLNTFAYSASQIDWVVRALEKIDSALQEQYEWDEVSSHSYYYHTKSKVGGVEVCLYISLLTSQGGSTIERNSRVNSRIGYSIELTCSNSTNKLFLKVCKEFEDFLKDYKKNNFLNSIEEAELFLNRIDELARYLESNFIEC